MCFFVNPGWAIVDYESETNSCHISFALQLQNWVLLIVQRGILEAKLTLEAKEKAAPVAAPTFSLDF